MFEVLADHAGFTNLRAAESRRTSHDSAALDRMLMPHSHGVQETKQDENDVEVMSNANSSVHGEHHFESSHDINGRLAAEKHAYLHSLHGMDDTVF